MGEIEDGFHGYPMDNFSAPLFFIGDDYAEVAASEISEPLAAQCVEHHGEKVYKGNVEYVFCVDGKGGDIVKGSVMATICSDEENFCTQADHTFEVALSGGDAAPAPADNKEAAAEKYNAKDLEKIAKKSGVPVWTINASMNEGGD